MSDQAVRLAAIVDQEALDALRRKLQHSDVDCPSAEVEPLIRLVREFIETARGSEGRTIELTDAQLELDGFFVLDWCILRSESEMAKELRRLLYQAFLVEGETGLLMAWNNDCVLFAITPPTPTEAAKTSTS